MLKLSAPPFEIFTEKLKRGEIFCSLIICRHSFSVMDVCYLCGCINVKTSYESRRISISRICLYTVALSYRVFLAFVGRYFGKNGFYNKTVSELHAGNLRDRKAGNRYSNLFNEKTSYWSEDMSVARLEVRSHRSCYSHLMFWAYDDTSSTFRTIPDSSGLHIINGMELGFSKILYKSENSIKLSESELEIMDRIMAESPDGLVYDSHVRFNNRNYLFFERGFKKLSLRQVSLTIRENNRVNRNRVACATSSDYHPSIRAYGHYFELIAKLRFDEKYLESDEYIAVKIISDVTAVIFKRIYRLVADNILNVIHPSVRIVYVMTIVLLWRIYRRVLMAYAVWIRIFV